MLSVLLLNNRLSDWKEGRERRRGDWGMGGLWPVGGGGSHGMSLAGTSLHSVSLHMMAAMI